MPPKRAATRKRQTKLNFSPSSKNPPKSSKAVYVSSDDSEDGASPDRRAKGQRGLEQETVRGMKLGLHSSPGKHGVFDSSEMEISSAASSSPNSDSDDGNAHIKTGWRKSKRSKKSKKPKKARKNEPSFSSSEEDVQPQIKKRSAPRRAATPEQESSGEDSEIDISVAPRTQKRKARSSSDEEAPPVKKKMRRVQQRAASPEEEEQEVELNEADELKEELAGLRSSPPPERAPKPKSAREKALEALRKRRAGNSEPPSSAARKKRIVIDSDESDSESELEIIQEEKEVEQASEDGSVGEEDDEENAATAHEAFNENEDDGDFIDDEDALIGVPDDQPDMPLQFSGLRNKKPRELFKYAIDWMVQKKINPSFSSDHEIYKMTFQKLDDEVSGLASSKFHSSVWTSQFTRAIRARPDLIVNEIDKARRDVLEPHCEACNRKNHTATYELSMTGKPYDKDTLEPLTINASESESNSDSDSDSSSGLSSTGSEEELNGEKPTYDAGGERIPPENRTFTLGSTCKANAQVAHTLYHWRYHLNTWVVDWLVTEGYCSPEKLAERDKWSVRKREKLANKIVKKMDEGGEIKKLHRQYKQQVDFAIQATNDYKRGWGRRG